ncbi:putative porin [Alishewanella sp. d11]|uniref:putative porin n=1 Tax=Alishewanella sp. d11 TaxID=3414030 RepID=UPI003BF86611
MKKLVIAALLTFTTGSVLANSFQHETHLDYGSTDLLNADVDILNLSHQFYLTPVRVSNMPLAEAGFLSRSSSVLFGYNYTQFDFGNFGKTSASAWSVGGEYRDTSHHFYASLLWTEFNNSSDRNIETSLGYYLDPSWLVKLDIEHFRPDGEGSATQYGVSTKKVMTLASGDFLNVEAGYMDIADSSFGRFGVAGDYYFGQNFSLGLAYDWLTKGIFDADEDAFTVRSNWYALPNLALKAAVTFDSLDAGDDVYQVGVTYRF